MPAEALARFLPAWHGIGCRAGGLDRLLEVVTQLEGVPIPASILERDVLRGPGRRLLARACSTSSAPPARWSGSAVARSAATTAGSRSSAAIGPSCSPRRARSRAERAAGGALHDAIREHLERRGATFFGPLRNAAPTPASTMRLLDALWDLVWSGEVTNDTLAPLRALVAAPLAVARATPARPPSVDRAAARRRPLVARRRPGRRGPLPTERGHAQAVALLERHGVVTREAVLAEGLPAASQRSTRS